MIAYILRGHIRMYCFYFVFTGGCGPINGGLISSSIRHHPLLVPYSAFFKSSTKCEI